MHRISGRHSLYSGYTVSLALRNAAVHMYLNYTKSLRRVADMLGNQFSKPALHNWLRNHPAPRHSRNRHSAVKVTSSVKAFLDSCLRSFQTLDSLVASLSREMHMKLGRSTVCKAIYVRQSTRQL